MKSHNRCFGFWLAMGSFIFSFFMAALCAMQFEFQINLINFSDAGTNPYRRWMQLHSLMLLSAGYWLWRCCPIINIDLESPEKSITIQNILFGHCRKYYFDELDGYKTKRIDHRTRAAHYEVLCIVRKGKVVLQIDSFYYSNFREIRKSLHDLKSLGKEKSLSLKVIAWLDSLVN